MTAPGPNKPRFLLLARDLSLSVVLILVIVNTVLDGLDRQRQAEFNRQQLEINATMIRILGGPHGHEE